MNIVTTKSGLKKSVDNLSETILVQGDLASEIINIMKSESVEISKIMESYFFKITPKAMKFYKCSNDTNLAINLLYLYDIVKEDSDKNLIEFEIQKNSANKRPYWK